MSPSQHNCPRGDRIQYVADLVACMDTPEKRKELEAFRIQFEKTNGPTDLTRRYTTLFPLAQQEWLLDNHPKLYWDGLPPFFQGYLRAKAENAAKEGKLDDIPSRMMGLYIRKEMNITGGSEGRSK